MNSLKFKTEYNREGLIAQRMSRQPMQSRKPASDQLPHLSHESKPRIEWSKPQKRIWVSYRLFHYYYPKKNRQGLGAYYAVVGRMSYHTKFGLHIANADHLKWQQSYNIDDRLKDGRRRESHHGHREGARLQNAFASDIGYLSQSVFFRKNGHMFGASVSVSQGMAVDDFIPFSPAVPFTAIQKKNNLGSQSQSVSAIVPQPAVSPSASLPARAMDIDGADDFSLVPIVVPMNIFVSAVPVFSSSETNGITNNPGFDFSLKTTSPDIQKNVFEKWHGRNWSANDNRDPSRHFSRTKPMSKKPEEKGVASESAVTVTDIQNKKNGNQDPGSNIQDIRPEKGNQESLTRGFALKTRNPKLATGNWTQETGNPQSPTPYIYSLRPHRIRHQQVIGAEALPE